MSILANAVSNTPPAGEAGRGKARLGSHPSPRLLQAARDLRQHMTDAEQCLWQCLRGKQLTVAISQQHPIARFVLDFYCPAAKLAIEIDGFTQHLVRRAAMKSARAASTRTVYGYCGLES